MRALLSVYDRTAADSEAISVPLRYRMNPPTGLPAPGGVGQVTETLAVPAEADTVAGGLGLLRKSVT